MKQIRWLVVVCILAVSLLPMSAGPGAAQSPSTQKSDPRQDERPTLGPRTAPPGEISEPNTSTTADPRRLLGIQTVYIESIDNALSEKIVPELGKLERFRLVTNAKQADAVLHGSCLESRRLKHVHSIVFLSGHDGGAIWQDSIYRPFSPPSLDQAVTETAKLIERHLEESIRAAER